MVEELLAALKPFADYADPYHRIPASYPITLGSQFARPQINMGDCYKAKEAIEDYQQSTFLRGTDSVANQISLYEQVKTLSAADIANLNAGIEVVAPVAGKNYIPVYGVLELNPGSDPFDVNSLVWLGENWVAGEPGEPGTPGYGVEFTRSQNSGVIRYLFTPIDGGTAQDRIRIQSDEAPGSGNSTGKITIGYRILSV